jgi:acetyl esterase/lipase
VALVAPKRLAFSIALAALTACSSPGWPPSGWDPYALPLPLAAAKDLRPSGDPGVAPDSSSEAVPASERRDVVYAPAIASGEPGLLDVFVPVSGGATARKAVMTLHGGAWRRGDKKEVRDFSRALAARGFVVFAVNYSLAPRARWPGQLEDLQKALRWIRANAASYGVDPLHVFAWGGSAGGHLATMLALRDDPQGAGEPLHGRVEGAVDAFGDADLALVGGMAPDEDGILADLLGAPRAGLTAEQLASASTVTYARPDAAVLILHGTADFSVSIQHSLRLNEALGAVGADVSFLRVQKGGHGPTTYDTPEGWRATLRFLATH